MNTSAAEVRGPQCTRQMLAAMKETLAVTQQYGGASTPHLPHRRDHQTESQQGNTDLKWTLGQAELIAIFRAFYPKVVEYTIFSSTHGIFSRIDHKQGHKVNLSKFKRTIVSSIFLNHNTIRLGINYKKKPLCLCCKKHKHMETCYKTANGSLKKSKRK